MAVLLISGMLLVAVIPLKNILSNPSTDVDSSPEYIRTMYFPQDVDVNGSKIEKPRPKYVPGELIIKFKKEATEEENERMPTNNY